jgi:hypothetical protein
MGDWGIVEIVGLHDCMDAWSDGVMGECDGVDVGREVGKK